MTDAAATITPPEVVTPPEADAAPETTALIVTGGEGMTILAGGLSGLPQMSKDMPLPERRDAVRDVLLKTNDMPDRLDVLKGEMLYEVHSNDYWKAYIGTFGDDTREYASFEEYALHELGFKKRKAYYLVNIYKKFCVELGLSPDILKGLEWSKAKEVVDVIDADNWVEILDKLKSMKVSEVKAMVREMKGLASGSDGEPSDIVRRAFALHEDQAIIVDEAVTLAKTMSGSDKDNFALELICADFMASSAGSGLTGALSKLEVGVKNLEAAFGVKLEIKSIDEERYTKMKAADAEAKGETVEEAAPEPVVEAAPTPEPTPVAEVVTPVVVAPTTES